MIIYLYQVAANTDTKRYKGRRDELVQLLVPITRKLQRHGNPCTAPP